MSTERDRLLRGPDKDEVPGGMGTVRFIARCDGDAEDVLRKCRKTLLAILDLVQNRCSDETVWMSTLPKEFVNACRPFPSQEEIEVFNRLPLEERARLDGTGPWSVRELMNAFLVLERWWFWWDAVMLDENHITVVVENSEWPFPWGLCGDYFDTAGRSTWKRSHKSGGVLICKIIESSASIPALYSLPDQTKARRAWAPCALSLGALALRARSWKRG